LGHIVPVPASNARALIVRTPAVAAGMLLNVCWTLVSEPGTFSLDPSPQSTTQ
jgi:hypothetical protein